MMQVIEDIVSPQGETRIETKGFAGHSCRQASQFLEQACGAKVAEALTAECYQREAAAQPLRQGGVA